MGVIISKQNNYNLLQEPPNYAFNKIVYIRGTKEGYKKISPFITTRMQSSYQKSLMKNNAQAMLARYTSIRNDAYSKISGLNINYSEDEIIRQQEKWVDALTQNLGNASGNLSESTASTMLAVQRALGAFKAAEDQNGKATLAKIHDLIEKLEKTMNQMPAKDKADLAGLIYSAQAIEKNVINVENGQIVFSRLWQTLSKIQQLSNSNIKGTIQSLNSEFGAIGEVMDTFALSQITSAVESALARDFGENVKFIGIKQTGNRNVTDRMSNGGRDPGGTVGRGTADAVFTYTGSYDGKTVTFDFGISLKTTGTVIGKNGKWIEKPISGKPKIKVKSISQKIKVWDQLATAIGNTVKAQNSILNTLVWSNASEENYKMITKSLLSRFLERYVSGGSLLANEATLGIDISDALMVNGRPIPIVWIIGQAISEIESGKLDGNNGIAFINLDMLGIRTWNKWTGEPNSEEAIMRSNAVRSAIQNLLTATVYLNGNALLSYFK